jgi:hypothetical protein
MNMTNLLRQHRVNQIFRSIVAVSLLVLLITSISWSLWHQSALPASPKCKPSSQADQPQATVGTPAIKPNLQLPYSQPGYILGDISTRAGFSLADNADPLHWAKQLNSG